MRFFEVNLLMREALPRELADLVMSFLKEDLHPWDDTWDLVPEYDADGNYGGFPMCPTEVSTNLPMW